jgi:hypothetical protein
MSPPLMNGQTHPPRPTSDYIARVLSAAFIQKPQRARQGKRDGLRPAHFPKPLQPFLEGITAPKPDIEKLRQDVSSNDYALFERLVERHTFNDEEIQRYIQFLIDGGATIGPEDQLLGLILRNGIRPSAAHLQCDHFQHPDLAELFEGLRGSEDYFGTVGTDEWLTAERFRKELVTRPNDHNARLAVWLADYAAPTAVDPDNPLEDPHDIVQRLAEQIRGCNEGPPTFERVHELVDIAVEPSGSRAIRNGGRDLAPTNFGGSTAT